MKTYNPVEKPDSGECPRHFCFCWHGSRSRFAFGTKLPVSVSNVTAVAGEDGRCANPFGTCCRYDPEHSSTDWYEDHGPHLSEAGLPWFYFYPSPNAVAVALRQKYIEESEHLWGKQHWGNAENKV